jgi:hypothetical protein
LCGSWGKKLKVISVVFREGDQKAPLVETPAETTDPKQLVEEREECIHKEIPREARITTPELRCTSGDERF